jgi:Uri superfamily endonuclease
MGPEGSKPEFLDTCVGLSGGGGTSTQLTENGDVLGAWIFPGGVECDLVDMYSALPVPIVGFGSTDCQLCRSHLLGPIYAKLGHALEVLVR